MRCDLLDVLRCPATGAKLSLEALDADGEQIRAGVLRGGVEEYPVVAGVPVLLGGYGDAVRLLRAGRPDDAAAAALLRQLPPSRLKRWTAAIPALPGGMAVLRAVEQRDRRRLRQALAELLRPAAIDPLGFVRLGFLGWGGHNPEAVNYFTFRFGTPRHLVALSAAEAAGGGPRGVLDLGCGAGHLTWGLGQRFGEDRTVGVDLSLFELWAAQAIAGSGRFVCGDATNLPFASGAFGLVMASDVLSFVRNKWAAAREALRTLAGDGTLVIAAVKSSLRSHVYAGMPLSPDGWAGLAGPLAHHLHADDRLLARYFAGHGPHPDDRGDVASAQTVTIVAGAGADARPGGWPRTTAWPHARGPLGVNPLLRLTAERADELVYRRRFPSENFVADNPPLADYLPEQVVVPRSALHGDQLDRSPMQHLMATTAVLALPPVYRRRQLPRQPCPQVGKP